MARGWRVTVRHASTVKRERAASLAEALDAARRAAESTLGEGGLDRIESLRDFEPGERVHTRVEISGPGLLRGREGGIDVMGDGAVVPYRGAIRKEKLAAEGLDDAIEALRGALEAG
jgi:hypothetical protein